MQTTVQGEPARWLGAAQTGILALVTIAAFHAGWRPGGSPAMIGFLLGVWWLAMGSEASSRLAFYWGLAGGLALYAPRLAFFWTIFGPAAAVLWIILAFWIGLFFLLSNYCRQRLGLVWTALLVPFLWTGLEYFRSELYYLKFSWLSPGLALAGVPAANRLLALGTYGLGFAVLALFSGAYLAWRRLLVAPLACAACLAVALWIAPAPGKAAEGKHLNVAGVQLEFPGPAEVVWHLNELVRTNPTAELIVLSEYTFDAEVPPLVTNWCRKHGRYLVVGGKSAAGQNRFFNTAFIVGPTGEIVFRQAKSVPIQFFDDGLRATSQSVWNSPWGKLGLCICYDLGYTRVIDRLVQQGAQGLIVPTMDVASWGEAQHRLHARLAPARAAEYDLPIFRLASSGISLLVNRHGRVQASAPFPGEGAMIAGEMVLGPAGRLPIDRWLAPACLPITMLAAGLAAWISRAAARPHSV